MKQIITLCSTSVIFLLLNFKTTGQVKIGDNPGTIKTASLLELESTNKGLVMPRVSLDGSINSPSPLGVDILAGTIVYNTNPAFVGGTGLQIWTGSSWMVVTPSSLNSSDAWKLTGNSSTNPASNFIGTTDAQPLIFKVNNEKAARLDYLNTAANTSFGYQSLNTITGGINNTSIGYSSLATNSTGNNNTANGYIALSNNTTGSGNVASGNGALSGNTTGSNNTGYGSQALISNTTGSNNTAVGSGANVGSGNLTNATAIGANASVAASNALILGNATDGVKVGIGTSNPVAQLEINKDGTTGPALLLSNNTGGPGSKASLQFTTYNPNPVAINPTATITASDDSYSSALSFSTKIPGSSANALQERMRINGNGSLVLPALTNGLLVADGSGNISTTSITSATANTWSLTGNSGTNPSSNFIGTADAQPLVFKVNGQKAGRLDYLITAQNTSFGYQSLNANTSGAANTAVGYQAFYNNTTGNNNTANGTYALSGNTTGNSNTADGYGALSKNTTGSDNNGYGFRSLALNITGNGNVAYGDSTLFTNATGSFNTAVGHYADVTGNNLTNATAIGYKAKVAVSNALVLGNTTDNVKVGIGTTAPTANLHVNGTVRFENLTNGILTTDASGNLSTTTLAAVNSNTWSLSGNSSTNPSSNFIGTADAQPLIFKVNGQKAGRLDYLNTAANTSLGYQALNSLITGKSNFAAGYQALFSDTSGSFNVANGYQALYANTTGGNNTANGSQALYNNTTGNDNIANGYQALFSNTTGNANIVNGRQALYNNTTGYNNIAIGYQSLYFNTTGIGNIANGTQALFWNTVGNANIANGFQALYNNKTGYNNIANGDQSLYFNIQGNNNLASGYQAMYKNTAGNNNIANGNQALFSNTMGSANIASGYQAMYKNTAGYYNIANGYQAMYNNTAGYYNIANGNQALYSNTSGNSNVANGHQALFFNTTGSSNVANGYQSLYSNTTGSSNTAVGFNADVNSGSLTNATAIGANARVSVSNAVVLGNNAAVGIGTSSPGANAKLEIVGSVSRAISSYRYMNNTGEGNSFNNGANYSLYTSNRIWCGEEINVTSDERTKTNIAASGSVNDLSLINKLRVVNYNYKDKVSKGTGNIKGFLAQEVEKVMPDAVSRNKGVVPDIYQNAVSTSYDSIGRILTVSFKEKAAVTTGDTIKIITDQGEQLVKVAAVSGNTITISNWYQNSKWAFIYGKQVNDMRNLDYNKIFSAGIGAIQELSKENDQLKKDNESVREDVKTLQAQVKMLMDKMNATVQSN